MTWKCSDSLGIATLAQREVRNEIVRGKMRF